MKKFQQFMNEEYTELSPRSQYIAEKIYKADKQLVLVKDKRGWRILQNEKTLFVL